MTDPPDVHVDEVAYRPLPESAYVRMTYILRGGLVLALAILAGGLLYYYLRHPGATAATAIGSNPILDYLTGPTLVGGLVHGHAEAILTVGLLVLLATPILRVASGFYYFQKSHDRGLARITLTVLVLLLVGLLVFGPLLR